MRTGAFAALLFCACGDDAAILPDATVTPDAATMCPPQTVSPLPPGDYKLYLATEGVDLVKNACDDATANCTSLITTSQSVPAFYANDASRTSSIGVITSTVQRALAPYSIDVVLERPQFGEYYMIVMGGSSTALTGTNSLSVAQAYCDDTHRRGLSLVFDVGSNSPTFYANSILSNFGAMLGMAVTAKKDDCMCRAGSVCNSTNEFLCTFGVDVTVNPDVHSCGRTTQDEPALLTAALGCR